MGRNTLKARLSRTGFWFCLPQLIGFLSVFLCPLALCIYYSMTAKSGGFSGLANYRDLWTSGTFRLALGNTFRFSAVGVLLLVGISFLLSVGFHHLLLYSSRKIKWMQSGLITPMVIPSAVIILFCQIFLDAGGVLNQWTGSKTLYLQQSPYAFWVLIGLYLWKNCGYCTVILLSALAGIDRAQYEAARCDGASVFAQVLHITLPQILPSLFFSAIIAIVGVFKIFRESYLLMGEYPHESVYMLQNFINNNMETLNYQRLSAASLIFLCILMVVIILFIRFSGILEEGGNPNGKKKKAR